MPLTDVTVISVVFNSEHCLRANADFLKQLPKLILVDNASKDGSENYIKKEIKNATYIKNKKNLGFGAASNQAIKIATTPYLFLLNPDCTVSLVMLEKLLGYINSYPDAAILAPQLIKKNGEKDISYRWPRSYWKSIGAAADSACCVGFVSGAAMLFNVKNSKQLFFDESFFLYYEDDDLCQRIFEERAQIVLLPEVEIVHQLGGSVKRKVTIIQQFYSGYHMIQSELIYRFRYLGLDSMKRKKIQTVMISPAKLLLFAVFLNPRKFLRHLGRLCGVLNMKKPT